MGGDQSQGASATGPNRMLSGTALAEDLGFLRQGNSAKAAVREAGTRWGYDSERPNDLFDGLTAEAPSTERLADQRCVTLARSLVALGGACRRAMLPGTAANAVATTGDGDQAAVSAYRGQLAALDGLPITYSMHPGTKLDRTAKNALFAGHNMNLGLRPDTLDPPQDYPNLLAAQNGWFAKCFGCRASAVRNHGFLNDGYWGHARSWETEDLAISSNLPGLDGRVLNGSLLPARLLLADRLLPH